MTDANFADFFRDHSFFINLRDRFRAVRNRAQASHFTIRLRGSNSNGLGMDIQTQKS
jgi:hypothetical protein